MFPAIHPCLVTEGSPLSWHGPSGISTLEAGSLVPQTPLADDGYHFEDGVKAALLIWLMQYISSHVQERMWYPSLSHLLPTWDVGKNPLFLSPFLNFIVRERL